MISYFPSVVYEHFYSPSKPPPAAIMSLLQRLRPIAVKVLRPTALSISRHPPNSYNEQQFLACMKSTAPGPNTFDRNELLRQFDELQSIKCNKTDIVAQAMELSSIPTDMNNNSDIVSQAMQMSNISSDIVMDF